jgi:hypothetical protein
MREHLIVEFLLFLMGGGSAQFSYIAHLYVLLVCVSFGIEVGTSASEAAHQVAVTALNGVAFTVQLITLVAFGVGAVPTPADTASAISLWWGLVTGLITLLELLVRSASKFEAWRPWLNITIKSVPVITTANLVITVGTYFYDLFSKIQTAVTAAGKTVEVKRSRSGKRRQWKPQGKDV